MPYNLNSNLFFIHIPKTGGSSIERCLQLDQLKGGYKFKYTKNNKVIQCKSSPQHLTLAVLEDAIENFTSFKHFTVVRNPYDRLVSEYHFSYDCRLQNNVMCKLKQENIISFNDFIHFIFLKMSEDERQLKFDNHFVPQVQYTQGKTNVQVFKLEEMAKLQEWLRVETQNTELIIPHDMKCQDRKPFAQYFTDKNILSVINKYYQKDFEGFNYDLIKL